jgi:hypothetical protein
MRHMAFSFNYIHVTGSYAKVFFKRKISSLLPRRASPFRCKVFIMTMLPSVITDAVT